MIKTATRVAVLAALICSAALGSDMTVPVDVQVPLFLKILTFDRNLPARANGDVTVAVVYQSRYRESLLAREAFTSFVAPRALTVSHLPLRWVHVDLDETTDLAAALRQSGADVVYVAPLRAVRIDTITAVTRALRITSVTGVPAYVREGVAIGIDARHGKPAILINREAQLAEGADLSSQLLRLATLVPGRISG